MTTNRTTLLLSGGLDSGSLLFWALHRGYDVLPLFVDYGQVTRPGEWQAVCALLDLGGLSPIEPISIPEVARLGTGTLVGSTASIPEYFPSRNLLLVTLAAMHSFVNSAPNIMIGLIADAAATLPDCSREFIDSLQGTLSVEYPEVVVQAPFIERSKVEIVHEAIAYGLRPEFTFSCNRFPDHHCWTCASCLDRLRVFKEIGLVYEP